MIDVRPLEEGEVDVVDACLPLHRLDQWRREGSTFLVAWDDGRPVGHAHIAWSGTKLGVPEVQDVFVAEEARRRGVATELSLAAEREAAARGHDRISLSVGAGNFAAQALYDRLGFEDAGLEPEQVHGTIMLRGEPIEVDDALVYLVKGLCGVGQRDLQQAERLEQGRRVRRQLPQEGGHPPMDAQLSSPCHTGGGHPAQATCVRPK